MGFLRISCSYCGDTWEVERGTFKETKSRTCPHCFSKIDGKDWQNNVLPAFEAMMDANRKLIKTHEVFHSMPVFTVDYVEDFFFPDAKTETEMAALNLKNSADDFRDTNIVDTVYNMLYSYTEEIGKFVAERDVLEEKIKSGIYSQQTLKNELYPKRDKLYKKIDAMRETALSEAKNHVAQYKQYVDELNTLDPSQLSKEKVKIRKVDEILHHYKNSIDKPNAKDILNKFFGRAKS